MKETYRDGGRRYTRVVERRLPLNFESLDVRVVYSLQTEYGMQKYDGLPVEITVIRKGERGKPWREILEGRAVPMEEFLTDPGKYVHGPQGNHDPEDRHES